MAKLLLLLSAFWIGACASLHTSETIPPKRTTASSTVTAVLNDLAVHKLRDLGLADGEGNISGNMSKKWFLSEIKPGPGLTELLIMRRAKLIDGKQVGEDAEFDVLVRKDG